MAQYSVWANDRLYQKVDRLPDDAYRADRRLPFGSIHGTLNHICLVDRLWLHRCKGLEFSFTSLDEELYEDRTELQGAIRIGQESWEEYVRATPTFDFGTVKDYFDTAGKSKQMQLGHMVMHCFNHGTHHRGQVSAALTQFKIDAPEMDLPFFLLK